jgi:hypothetical protein
LPHAHCHFSCLPSSETFSHPFRRRALTTSRFAIDFTQLSLEYLMNTRQDRLTYVPAA